MAKKSRVDIARDVIAGYYGSGDKRISALKKEGYDPNKVQGDVNTILCCRENIINNIKAQAKNIANNNNWWYVFWNEKYGHECAICHPHGGENHGWQCIGYGIACWHHAGLPIPCNCGVIADEYGDKLFSAKTDAEALKLAKKYLKLDDIQVIRNKGKMIPKSKAKPGDIALLINDDGSFQHLYVIMSDKYIADSTSGTKSKADNIRSDRKFSGRYANRIGVLIRYVGKGLTTPPKRTTDELAQEVIAGLWGSGDSRKTALTEAGHNYDIVQKRVDEIINPTSKKKTVNKLAQEVIDGKWGSGNTRKKKLTEAGYDYNVVQKKVNEIISKKEKQKSGYTGKIPTLRLKKTNAEVIADTIKWAKWIASDNRFHYGYGKHAHHNGCYFCGTQRLKMNHGIIDPQFTYCCNPFVGAAWAHGGCVPTAIKKCQNTDSWDFSKGKGYDTCSLFTKLGKPAVSSLKPGDVLCGDTHVALYIGNGKVIQASGGDDNVRNSKKWNNSIAIGTWSGWKRAYRFNGSVDADIVMRHGEVSNRVEQWQNFLDWCYDGKFFKECGGADGCFGDNTLRWTKKFQEEYIGKGQGDGLVGNITINKAKEIKK